jgi:hypothetical protein
MSHHDHHHEHHDHHHHGHDDHSHHHDDPDRTTLSEKDKLAKMVEHWMRHSDEHAASYRQWAEKARAMGQDEVYRILEEVASAVLEQNQNLARAIEHLKGS